MSSHSKEVGISNHTLPANPNSTGAPYADIAARDADVNFNTAPVNVDKLVKVASPLSYWMLTSIAPTWQEFGDSGRLKAHQLVVNAQFSPEVNSVFYDGWVVQENLKITKGSLFAVTAPTGAAIVVDILINGAVQSKFMTLAALAIHQLTDITDLVVTAGQRVGLKFTQVGSNNPGNGIIATLHYELT